MASGTIIKVASMLFLLTAAAMVGKSWKSCESKRVPVVLWWVAKSVTGQVR